ncbi:MAG: hypothetical protein IIA40_08875, partial [SAR324 cluster bacterium]|nr:hypothetical protein [SAR324 cluster bacterium]
TLASYATEGILFGTHSIGLARTAADTIYTIRRIGEGGSEVRIYDATVRLTEFLGELNFSGRELGFDNVLFVEGPTDVKTVQQFLRLYNKDRRFVLISLGGAINPSRQTDLEEILRITKNVLVLIDSERDRPNAELESNRRDFIDICRKHDIKCHVLERRAIENYFIDRAVKEVKGSKCRSLGHYEKFEDVDPRWRKRDNWRIAREMTREEIAETDVGQFIDLLGV